MEVASRAALLGLKQKQPTLNALIRLCPTLVSKHLRLCGVVVHFIFNNIAFFTEVKQGGRERDVGETDVAEWHFYSGRLSEPPLGKAAMGVCPLYCSSTAPLPTKLPPTHIPSTVQSARE